VKKGNYSRYLSTKINIKKGDLADAEKISTILKKARRYFAENFEGAKLDEE
jgi:hypothetical protein